MLFDNLKNDEVSCTRVLMYLNGKLRLWISSSVKFSVAPSNPIMTARFPTTMVQFESFMSSLYERTSTVSQTTCCSLVLVREIFMTNKSNKKIFRDCIFSAKESQDCTNEQNEKKNLCTTIKFFFNIIKKK